MPTFDEILARNFNPMNTERLTGLRDRLEARRAENVGRLQNTKLNRPAFQNFPAPSVSANQDEWLNTQISMLDSIFGSSFNITRPEPVVPDATVNNVNTSGVQDRGGGGSDSDSGQNIGTYSGVGDERPGLLHPVIEFLLGDRISKPINKMQQKKIDAYNLAIENSITTGIQDLTKMTGFSEAEITAMVNSKNQEDLSQLNLGFTQTGIDGLTTSIGNPSTGNDRGETAAESAARTQSEGVNSRTNRSEQVGTDNSGAATGGTSGADSGRGDDRGGVSGGGGGGGGGGDRGGDDGPGGSDRV